VLYVGLEGARGLRHRMAAYAQHMGSAGRILARMTTHTPLDKSEAGRAGEAAIIEQAKRLTEAAGHPVGLIIIDTFARAVAGDDENAAMDMSSFVGRLQAIARETGAAVLVVHHPGKDDTRGMRGSTVLFAACDVVIKVTANGSIKEVTTEKVKEGVIETLFSYRLKQVSLGEDEDGDTISTCIVEAMDSSGKATPMRPPPESQRGRALGELEELVIAQRGKPASNHRRAPDGAMLISKDRWRNACREKRLTGDGGPEVERKAFWRALTALNKAGLVGDFGDDVWLVTGHRRDMAYSDYGRTSGTWPGHPSEDAE
jgi:CBS domain-containing protein